MIIRHGTTAGVLLALVASLATGPSVLAQDACSADLEARLDTQEQEETFTRLQFAVELHTSEPCARIEYDLVITIQLANDQVHKVRLPQVVKLDDGELTSMVRYELPSGERIIDYEARLVRCERCAAET
jgi:hypothetical protein